MYKNTKRIDTMFVQKNVRRNYQWQKIIMLQKTVQTKIHMDPIRMRMLSYALRSDSYAFFAFRLVVFLPDAFLLPEFLFD